MAIYKKEILLRRKLVLKVTAPARFYTSGDRHPHLLLMRPVAEEVTLLG